MANEQHFDYDVFISYSHKDEAWVEDTLLPKLEAKGVSVCIDFRDFDVGKSSMLNMEDAAARSRHTLLVLTPAWLKSEWTFFEALISRGADPAGLSQRTIPLLVKDCREHKIPGFISMLTRADFTRTDRQDIAWTQVFDAVKPANRSSATPADTASLPSENPFTEVRAIQDPERFIGRTAELRRLEQLLSGGSVSVTGEAKIGKSSLLWQLKHRWQDTVIGPIDFQQVENVDDFYQEVADALSLEDNSWRTIRSALRSTPALLLLDEMDNAPACGLEARHTQFLRSLCDQNRHLHIVTASRRPLREVFAVTSGSPLYNILSPLPLGPLTAPEAKTLLVHPWVDSTPSFSPGVADELIAVAGTKPFRLQCAAFHRYEALFNIDYDWCAEYRQHAEQML